MNKTVITILNLLGWIGGLIALLVGYNHFSVWISIADFLFATRIFDILLYKSPDRVRLLGSLAAGLVVAIQ
jgi:hypothetical protein